MVQSDLSCLDRTPTCGREKNRTDIALAYRNIRTSRRQKLAPWHCYGARLSRQEMC